MKQKDPKNETTPEPQVLQSPVLRKEVMVDLPHDHSPELQREMGIELARLIEKIDGLETELETIKADFKGRIKVEMDAAAIVAKRLNKGFDTEPTPCEEHHDYDRLLVRIIRVDTGDIIKERAMTPSEQQQEIQFRHPAG